jgi:acetyltransferase-like isoleucine patch superfamily enzyme
VTAVRTALGRAAGALLRLLADVLLRGVLDAVGTAARRARRIPPRDPRQARFITVASLQWVRQHRAWSWFYLVRYLRFARLRLRSPHIVTEGFVFLGRNVELLARRGYGRLVLGRWVHIGSGNALRSHEGTLRIGDKCVFGKDNTVNGYLDIEFGAATIVADWVYVCDFDHVFTEIHWPIKDQGITKSPVRIGPDVWLGTKVTILRGVTVGQGCVVAAHALVNTDVPPYSVAVGVPVRVVRDRIADYADAAATRAALADIARKHEAAAAAEARRPVPDDAVPEVEAEGAPVAPHGPADPRLHGAGRP